VRQIRLRDLGGIIVLTLSHGRTPNREKVLSALQMALEQDKAPSKALRSTSSALVCITRKRTKQAWSACSASLARIARLRHGQFHPYALL